MKKSVGLNINKPKEKCGDPNCAWHGKISVRGRVFNGIVVSTKSHNTAIIEWKYHRYVPKYERFERRKSKISVHNPPCINAKEGEDVVAIECRPLSKTKHFIVVGKTKLKEKVIE